MRNSTFALPGASVALACLALACAQTSSSRPAPLAAAAATAQSAPPASHAAASAPAQVQPAPRAEPGHAALPALVPEITARELEAHIRFLASDALKGRSTGTPEARVAAQYLADVLHASGIAPAGDDGTYFQRVPLERVRSSAAPALLVTPKEGAAFSAVFGVDFRWPLTLELDTPALAIVHVRAPGELPRTADANAALFLDLSTSDQRRELARIDNPGAVGWGAVLAPLRERAGRQKPAPAPGEGTTPWSPPQPKRARARTDTRLELGGTLLERVRNGEIATLQLTTHVERADVDAVNVVGVLRGAGTSAAPELAHEAVVLSAHYDHLPPLEPDTADGAAAHDLVFNGADDDASGCAAVLELAGVLGHAAKPARTIVFLLATGEEIGLLGTEAYLDHPFVPLDHTVANLNFEMIGRPDTKVGGAGVMWFTGYERTNLGAAFAAAGVPLKLDPRPDKHFYERSDNYAFVKRGVVGQSFSSFDDDHHKDYHEVSDEADHIDFAHMETCVSASATAVGLVARGELRPEWLPGQAPKPRTQPPAGDGPR